jgi:hypothetical protein
MQQPVAATEQLVAGSGSDKQSPTNNSMKLATLALEWLQHYGQQLTSLSDGQ